MITYPDGFPEGQLQFNIDSTPRKITGIQKVAQIFLKILFSTKGSDVIYPNRGTMFQTYTINANLISTSQTLQSDLISAVNDAGNQTKVATSTNTDPASRLNSVKIAGFDVTDESIVMYLQMITDAGETAQVAVPFPQTGLS